MNARDFHGNTHFDTALIWLVIALKTLDKEYPFCSVQDLCYYQNLYREQNAAKIRAVEKGFSGVIELLVALAKNVTIDSLHDALG